MASDRPYKEPKVKQLVKDWFDSHRAFSWAPVSNGFGVHGIPDRVGCVPVTITKDMVGKTYGLFVGIESKGSHRKAEKDKGVSPQQRMRLNEILNAFGFAAVVYGPEDIAQLSEKLAWPTRLTTPKQ
jgi:hypothetical protein